MKKFMKFLGAAAALTAAAAGCAVLYKKYFAPEEDFEDAFEDEFEDDFEEELDESPERGYVSLHSSEEAPAGEATEAAKEETGAEE